MVKETNGYANLLLRQRRILLLLVLVSLLGLLVALTSCQQELQEEPTSRPTVAKLDQVEPGPTTAAERQATEQQAEPTSTKEGISATKINPTAPAKVTGSATPAISATATEAPNRRATSETEAVVPEGALISVQMDGQVGVLLDEIPEDMRDRVVESLMDRPESYWIDLARRQIRLTKRRLNFRNFAYENKGQLPLPPEALWSIQLDPAGVERVSIQGHDLVLAGYTFSSTLLTAADSPGEAEPELRQEGGKWSEPFLLPADPDFLLQRTGNACLNEAGFPPNSFDSENAWVFFDHACEADSGGILGCHRSRLHQQSCVEALTDRVGTIETEIQFERLKWDPKLADAVRVGEVTHLNSPDLKVVGDDLNSNRIIYRYFPEDSCALVEQCVSGSGWRRLLQFNATVHNVGAETMYIGPVVAENPVHNLFQYNACHAHYHFSDYGDFIFAGDEENLSSKQAFCVESTNRFSNNEWSPLTHDYSCRFQGVQAGWVDEYVAGLDCQWVDITDIDVDAGGSSFSLGLASNPDGFLCEGALVLDDDGNPLWEPSGQTTPEGAPINRPQCEFVSDWDVNNNESRDVFLLPAGSFVNEPCAEGQLGPLRNCGFSSQLEGIEILAQDAEGRGAADPAKREVEAPEGAFTCTPGEPVQLTCSVERGAAPQVTRLCEYSAVLGSGVACTFSESLANEIVGAEATEFAFTCPSARDEDEPGGLYSLYTAPALSEDEPQPISCVVE